MYQTTAPIISLAGNGLRIRAYSNVTPQLFTPEQWEALLTEGVIVEIVETETEPEPEPEPESAKPARARKSKQ